SNRYLLSFKETLFVEKNKNLITWGRNQGLKTEYLGKSVSYFKKITYASLGVFAIFFLGYLFTRTTYYRYEFKTRNEIKNTLLTNKSSLIPDFLILDSLAELEPEFVKEFCLASKEDYLILMYLQSSIRHDS